MDVYNLWSAERADLSTLHSKELEDRSSSKLCRRITFKIDTLTDSFKSLCVRVKRFRSIRRTWSTLRRRSASTVDSLDLVRRSRLNSAGIKIVNRVSILLSFVPNHSLTGLGLQSRSSLRTKVCSLTEYSWLWPSGLEFSLDTAWTIIVGFSTLQPGSGRLLRLWSVVHGVQNTHTYQGSPQHILSQPISYKPSISIWQ